MKIIKAILAAAAIMFAANAQAADYVNTPINDENADCFALRVPVAKAANVFYKQAKANPAAWRAIVWGKVREEVKNPQPVGHIALMGAVYIGIFAEEASNARELTEAFFNECIKDPETAVNFGHDMVDKMMIAAAEEMMYEDE